MSGYYGGGGASVANEDFANTLDAADSTARLALAYGTADGEVQLGDIVRQVDTGAFYMLIGSTPSNSAHWQQLSALPASIIASGQLALARGGTGADLSATGGTGQVLKQTSAGGVVTVGTVDLDFLSDVAITTPASGHVISHNGTNWVNRTLAAAGILATPSMTSDYVPKWNGTALVDSALQFASSNAILAGALAWDTGYNRFIGPNGTANDLYTVANGLLVFNSGGTSQRANISSTGLAVGLGTTAASAPLHARKTSGSQFICDHSNGNQFDIAVDGSGNSTLTASGNLKLAGDNRAAYDASPSATTIRDILISFGLMAES